MQVWTLIAVLTATLFGLFFFVGGKIDGINGRIDQTNDRINGVTERIDQTNDRINGVTERIDQTNDRLGALGDSLNSRIDKLTERLERHLETRTS